MIRKTNDVQEGKTNEVQEGNGVINDDPEYNPREDEVTDGEEGDHVVVEKTVKLQTLSCLEEWEYLYALCFLVLTHLSCGLMLFPCHLYEALKKSRRNKYGVKNTVNKKRKSSETSAAMPPGRVMAVSPGQTKRILEPNEPTRVGVTRQKEKMVAVTNHQESLLHMDPEISLQMGDEFPPMDEESTLPMDERGTDCLDERGTTCIDEADTLHTNLSPIAPSVGRNIVITKE
ncbi:hypothetical protein D1007_51195 [Hordeum vulgare]|nr:hypothetical protein D1007_51195 [Hordeum vulgare]